MKLRTPEYFQEFHCIADKCNDCCCIGWEIDIDKKTANLYKNTPGEFGQKLQKSIDFNTPCHFILNSKNRCPLLNSQNLCEVFINLGEKNMCDICTEHPRYYEWFSGIKEGGTGLCCEESARIILSQNQPFKTVERDIPFEDADSYDSELYSYLLKCREKIISQFEDISKPFNLQIRNILWYSYTIQLDIDSNILDDEEIIDITSYEKSNVTPILNLFTTLEPLNPEWISYLKNCISIFNKSSHMLPLFENKNSEIFRYLHNIAIYFIWRYFLKGVFDNNILQKVKFMAVSVYVIKILFFSKWIETSTLTFKDCIEIVKNFSKEIEYCEENLQKLDDVFNNSNDFSINNLIGLF